MSFEYGNSGAEASFIHARGVGESVRMCRYICYVRRKDDGWMDLVIGAETDCCFEF